MTTNRFKVTAVDERDFSKKTLDQSPEAVPLINTENDMATHSLPTFTSINETNKATVRTFNNAQPGFKKTSSMMDIVPKQDISSSTNIGLNINNETEECDSHYSTIQSHTYDTNSLGLTDKFLYELRLKRRELRDKANNLSIDQRIALNRRQYNREIRRAQDIFDVHFESNDTENVDYNPFSQDAQEKIRNNIFDELDRQRMRQFHKHHRQLICGRALLMIITSFFAFMSFTLIYVVMNLYDRGKDLDKYLPDNKFVSMVYDTMQDV